MGEFVMPSLGADMDRGTLVEWRVDAGDLVRRGDIVASVETDKAVIDVEVFETGVVEELLVEPGDVVPVGTPLARLRPEDDGVTAHAPTEPGTEPEPEPEPKQPDPASVPEPGLTPTGAAVRPGSADREQAGPAVPGGPAHRHATQVLSPLVRVLAERLHVDTDHLVGTGHGGRVTRDDVESAARSRSVASTRSSPRARRMARDLQLELSTVTGSGPSGAVRTRDLPGARSSPPASTPTTGGAATAFDTASTDLGADAGSDADPMRSAIARTMERSNREIPHYHLSATVDLSALMAWLGELNHERPPGRRVLPAAAILRAVASSAHQVRGLNGAWLDGRLSLRDDVDLGVLVSLRTGGLLAPVIHGAHRRSTDELMQALTDLVERTRRGALRSSELAGATISVTNLGDRGVDEVHGVIHPPQLALVGAGRIAERPLVVDGQVLARPSVVLTLAADHRGSDGRTGSRFLRRIETLLTHPERLDDEEDQ